MGCAPSIHVSQSGIVYCREDIRESSSGARASSVSEVVSHIHSAEQGTLTSTVRITRGCFLSSDKPRSVDTDSQNFDLRRMEEPFHSQDGRKEFTFGPMKLFQNPMSILLVFPNEDFQSSAFSLAAHRGSYNTKQCATLDGALDYFSHNHPELIIIDLRCPQSINGQNLCRKIRATYPEDNAVLVGVTKASDSEDSPSVLPLLNIGFNRIFVESRDVGKCYNALVMLEHGEIRSLAKIRTAACLFSATENCHDSIEIASLDTERGECLLQYANPVFEKLTGHSRKDVIGEMTKVGPYPSNCKDSGSGIHEPIYSQLKEGKTQKFEDYTSQRKNGEVFKQNLQIIPVIGRGGNIAHLVAIKQEMKSGATPGYSRHILQSHLASHPTKEIIISSGPTTARRPSVTSVKIEPYITKVIKMINSAKENSSPLIMSKLTRVIEILQTKELYSIGNQTEEEDEVPPNELFDGLMRGTGIRRASTDKGHPRLAETSIFPGRGRNQTPLHVTEAPPDVLAALEGDSSWDYNIVQLEAVTHNKPLYYLGMVIFNRFNACQFLNISESCLREWLRLIEANYHERNTYHNSTHAADVLHSTAYFLMKERVKNTLEPMDEVAALIAAAVHDVDHPGFTNSFLCNATDHLAVLYNDIAVLESHHAALSFKKTAENPSSDIFKGLRADDYRVIRQSIIDMVMATEMTRHFEHLSKFVNSINKRRTSSIGEVTPVGGRSTPESTTSSSVLSTPENRTLIKRMLIKCADISNPARPRFLCETWANRIAEEYFNQTDEEKRRGLPVVMPVFDRATCNVPRSQVWFIDYFVSDLYDAWDAFAHVPETIRHLTNNYEYWKKEAEDKDELLRQTRLNSTGSLAASPPSTANATSEDNTDTTATFTSV